MWYRLRISEPGADLEQYCDYMLPASNYTRFPSELAPQPQPQPPVPDDPDSGASALSALPALFLAGLLAFVKLLGEY